jgi:uncharacterized iron-regulated membrane protein
MIDRDPSTATINRPAAAGLDGAHRSIWTRQPATAERPRPTRSWWRVPPRVWVRRVHLWATLSLGLLLLVVTTTGAAIVLRPEIDRLFNRSHYQASPGPAVVALDEAIRTVRAAYPDAHISFVTPPENGDRYLIALEEPYQFLFVDPATGELAGPLDAEGGVLGFLTRAHISLFTDEVLLPGVGWPLSQVLLGVSALALLVMVVTGAFLWWPGIRRFFARGFGIRLGRNSYTSNHDLHKVIGVIALLPLLLWALTGANFEFYEQTYALWYALTPGEPAPELAEVASTPGAGLAITADEAVRIAVAAVPGARFSSLVPPAEESGYYDVWVSRGIDPYEHGVFPGETLAQVDQYSGEILQLAYVTYDTAANEAYEMWSYPIHSGILAPWPIRLLWIGFGLTPLGLAVTGVAMWWLKRRKTRRVAARVAATALPQPVLVERG